jgi:hypothetical protein
MLQIALGNFRGEKGRIKKIIQSENDNSEKDDDKEVCALTG